MKNESLSYPDKFLQKASQLIELREDLQSVHEKVFIDFRTNTNELLDVQFERKRKILQIRRRLMDLVFDAKEAIGQSRLYLAEVERCKQKLSTEWQVLTESQKEDLAARIQIAEAQSGRMSARIAQCELELDFDLAYVNELLKNDTTRSIS